MSQKITIGYVIVNENEADIELTLKQVKTALPYVTLIKFTSVCELYKTILEPTSLNLDVIAVDVDHLCESSCCDCGVSCESCRDQIATINRLVRNNTNSTKILGVVSETTDVDQIRMLIPNLDGFCIMDGQQWSVDDVIADIKKYTQGDYSMPVLVAQLLASSVRKRRTVLVTPCDPLH